MHLCFLSILGEPGSYDPAVYSGVAGGDDECHWFRTSFGYLQGLTITGLRISHGDPVPAPRSSDAFILGGSYNSVHDELIWQQELLGWFDALAAAGRPLLGICGGHQLMSRYFGAQVGSVATAPVAGTRPVALTEAGRGSALFDGHDNPSAFHFANYEHVLSPPEGATVLAESEQVPVAALDYGRDWYSVQFHPEAEVETLAVSWAPTHPHIADSYVDNRHGKRLIENFLKSLSP